MKRNLLILLVIAVLLIPASLAYSRYRDMVKRMVSEANCAGYMTKRADGQPQVVVLDELMVCKHFLSQDDYVRVVDNLADNARAGDVVLTDDNPFFVSLYGFYMTAEDSGNGMSLNVPGFSGIEISGCEYEFPPENSEVLVIYPNCEFNISGN